MRKKRKLFDQLMEGFDALADQRAGKRTFRTHAVKPKPVPQIRADELTKVREDMKLSRSLFARYLRTNVRTLENWEQGRAKPSQTRKRRCSFASCSAIPIPYGVSRRSENVARHAARLRSAFRSVRSRRAVLTLRCTQRVRTRLRLPEQFPEAPASTGALGDWYVHLVRFGRSEFAIATSERCLLTLLLPARELRTSLVPNLHASLRSLLQRLDVPDEQVSRELDAMQPVSFARATNRRVLGSMNDLAFQASHYLAHGGNPATLAERLAHTPMSAIGEKPGHLGFPDMLARALLTAGVG